jgi:hypothetical protein
MDAAAPNGAPRRINNREHGKHGTAPPCPGEALRRGVLISAFFMVPVWNSKSSCPFLQSRFFISSGFPLMVLPLNYGHTKPVPDQVTPCPVTVSPSAVKKRDPGTLTYLTRPGPPLWFPLLPDPSAIRICVMPSTAALHLII